MGRRKPILASAAGAMLIALPAGWYFGSPWWTLWRIREAARDGDAARLASYVDYRAILTQAEAEGRRSWESVLDMARSDSPGDRQLIAIAKRQLAKRISEDTAKEEIGPWLTSIPIRPLGGGGAGYRPYIVHRGLDGFEVRDEGASLEYGPLLTFRRHGLGWKLVAVRFGQQ